MRRREFITVVGGAAAAWPLTARAHARRAMRRIAVLMGGCRDDLPHEVGLLPSCIGSTNSGWREGRNLVMQVQWWE